MNLAQLIGQFMLASDYYDKPIITPLNVVRRTEMFREPVQPRLVTFKKNEDEVLQSVYQKRQTAKLLKQQDAPNAPVRSDPVLTNHRCREGNGPTRILALLEQNPDRWFTSTEIAQHIGMSRTIVWTNLPKMKEKIECRGERHNFEYRHVKAHC